MRGGGNRVTFIINNPEGYYTQYSPRGCTLDRNEFQTLLEMIDVLLKEQALTVSVHSRVLMEVDTRQSDFAACTLSRTEKYTGILLSCP